MLFLKEKPELIVENYKEAPCVNTPYIVNDEKRTIPFYENNATMNQIIGGYNKTADNSCTRELMEKYPLDNE